MKRLVPSLCLSPLPLLILAAPALAGGWHHDCEREASRADVREARAHGRLSACELERLAEFQRNVANARILAQYQSPLMYQPRTQPLARPPAVAGPFSPRVLDPAGPGR